MAVRKELFQNQEEDPDNFGGFGSLTEMVKNKDLLIEKELNGPPKEDTIALAKMKMKKALDDAAQREKAKFEEENKKRE